MIQVLVKTSLNWNDWGVILSDEDGDGVYTGSIEVDPGTSFEYITFCIRPWRPMVWFNDSMG